MRCVRDIGLKCYRPQFVHGLKKSDPEKRLEFANFLFEMLGEDEDFLDRILWTDEAKFNVLAGIWSGGIIEPFFITENLTGERYKQLLEDQVVPAIMEQCPIDIIFQQDGVPCHLSFETS